MIKGEHLSGRKDAHNLLGKGSCFFVFQLEIYKDLWKLEIYLLLVS